MSKRSGELGHVGAQAFILRRLPQLFDGLSLSLFLVIFLSRSLQAVRLCLSRSPMQANKMFQNLFTNSEHLWYQQTYSEFPAVLFYTKLARVTSFPFSNTSQPEFASPALQEAHGRGIVSEMALSDETLSPIPAAHRAESIDAAVPDSAAPAPSLAPSNGDVVQPIPSSDCFDGGPKMDSRTGSTISP